MESEGDEAVPRRPKRSKRIKRTHFPSISSQDSVLPMPNLPPELISEILLKLPVESLLRFRPVSKSWLSLISSPEFVKAHLLLSASNKNYFHHGVMTMVNIRSGCGFKDCSLRSLLYHPVRAAVDLEFPGNIPHDYSWFVGSVNGLICFGIRLVDGSYNLFLWNPSIRKYKKLPDFKIDRSHSSYVNEYFDFFKWGFAYDELQDDYKVVGVFHIHRRGHCSHAEVKIYSLRRDSWRRIDDLKGRELSYGSAKFVNGKLHWLDQERNIISLDLTDEKWAEIEQPCYFEGCKEKGRFKLGVLKSDLSVSCINMWTHVDVWVMKEYGIKESWTKMFTIKSPNYPIGHKCYPTILMSNEGELLLEYGSRIVKYNTKDDSIRYLHVTNFGAYFQAETYVKSLICPF